MSERNERKLKVFQAFVICLGIEVGFLALIIMAALA